MNTEREKIINIAYRVYKAHGSREAVKRILNTGNL